MVGTHSYLPSSNLLTSIGGTTGSPIAYIDQWNADKTGTLALHTRTGITAVDGTTVLFTYALRPTDRYMLGGNVAGATGGIWLVVSNFSGFINVTVRLVGANFYGVPQTEDLTIMGNGNYAVNQFFKTLTSSWIVAVTGAGSIDYTVTQGQWGVVWRQGATQYTYDCFVKIGDGGTTATVFIDAGKHIAWSNFMSFGSVLLEVTSNATFIGGTLLSATEKTTCNGLHFFVANTSGQRVWIQCDNGSTVYFYSTTFEAASSADFYISYYPKRLWNCVLDQAVMRYSANVDFYNVQYWNIGNNGCFQNSYAGNTFSKISAFNCSSVIKTDGTGPPMIYNLYGRNNSYILLWNNNQVGAKAYLINPDIDIYLFAYTGNYSATYQQYDFDLTTEPSATVTLKDASGNTALYLLSGTTWNAVNSVVADATTGKIPTHNFRLQYYDTTHGNVPVCSGPFTLRIEKAGKIPYEAILDIPVNSGGYYDPHKPFDLKIKLHDQLTGTADIADVAAGATFYKDNADAKLTGTLALTGNALPEDVADGKTFYSDNPSVKRAGTHVNPAVFIDVISGRPILNLNKKNLDNQNVLSL